jgi:hypothetical protein
VSGGHCLEKMRVEDAVTVEVVSGTALNNANRKKSGFEIIKTFYGTLLSRLKTAPIEMTVMKSLNTNIVSVLFLFISCLISNYGKVLLKIKYLFSI